MKLFFDRIIELLKGQFRLSRAFWVFGVAIWIPVSIALPHILGRIPYIDFIKPEFMAIAVVGVMGIYWVCSYCIVLLIWRSATNHVGKRLWARLAKVYAVFMFVVIMLPGLSHVIPLSLNPNTAPVINGLRPTPQTPLVGFWKESRWKQYGVAIAPATDGLYSLSFCGPGGCFKPGQWTPNTAIVNDPKYRIIDANTIEFHENETVSTIYKRFTPGVEDKGGGGSSHPPSD